MAEQLGTLGMDRPWARTQRCLDYPDIRSLDYPGIRSLDLLMGPILLNVIWQNRWYGYISMLDYITTSFSKLSIGSVELVTKLLRYKVIGSIRTLLRHL